MSEAKNAIFEKLQDIIAKQLSIDPKDIKTSSSFTSDLDADSLDVVELVMTFEEEFDVPIEDEVAGEMSTVQDAIDYIAKVQKS
jgi:acyl carrier protein